MSHEDRPASETAQLHHLHQPFNKSTANQSSTQLEASLLFQDLV